MTNRTVTNIIILIGILSVIICSCHQPEKEDTHRQVFNSFVVNEPLSMDPHRAWDHPGGVITSQIYEGLVEYSPKEYRIVPCLATHWTVEDSGCCFIFELRKGVYFQDDPCFPGGKGREMVASDIAYSWNRKLPNRNFMEMITRSPADSVELTILSDYQILVRFNKPRMSFVSMLTRTFGYIVPREAVEYYGENIVRHPVGTGPFRLTQWEKTRVITLVKNETYWQKDSRGKKLPFIDELNFWILPDDLIRFNEFIQKRLHIGTIPPALYYRLIDSTRNQLRPEWQRKGIRLIKSSDCLNSSFILLASYDPYELPPTSSAGHLLASNQLLRQALNYAVSRKALVRQHYPGGQAEPAFGFLPPLLNPRRKWGFSYDPKKTVNLLKRAGFHDGKNLPEFKMVISSTSRDIQTAQTLIRQYQKFNIRIRLIPAPFAEIRNAVLQNNAEMEWNGWIADFPDAINFIETVDLNTYQIDGQTDSEKRNQRIAEWESRYLEKAPRIFLYHRSGRQLLIQNDVRNLVISPISLELYKYVKLK